MPGDSIIFGAFACLLLIFGLLSALGLDVFGLEQHTRVVEQQAKSSPQRVIQFNYPDGPNLGLPALPKLWEAREPLKGRDRNWVGPWQPCGKRTGMYQNINSYTAPLAEVRDPRFRPWYMWSGTKLRRITMHEPAGTFTGWTGSRVSDAGDAEWEKRAWSLYVYKPISGRRAQVVTVTLESQQGCSAHLSGLDVSRVAPGWLKRLAIVPASRHASIDDVS